MFCRCELAYLDRKSTRLNSSHLGSSYAVFCSKKKSALAALTGSAFLFAGMQALALYVALLNAIADPRRAQRMPPVATAGVTPLLLLAAAALLLTAFAGLGLS